MEDYVNIPAAPLPIRGDAPRWGRPRGLLVARAFSLAFGRLDDLITPILALIITI